MSAQKKKLEKYISECEKKIEDANSTIYYNKLRIKHAKDDLKRLEKE